MKIYAPTEKSKVKRLPNRASYDQKTLFEVLDAGFIAHIAYIIEGEPYVTPTSYWRKDDIIYWHGSSVSRMLDASTKDIPVCVTVTHIDGLVLARSGFHHSLNYRSAMIFGKAEFVKDDEKNQMLYDFMERLYPGRWNHVRPPSAQELKATHVVQMKIQEASVKIRTGAPKDDEADYALPVWAGVVPIIQTTGISIEDQTEKAVSDPKTKPSTFEHIGLIRPTRENT